MNKDSKDNFTKLIGEVTPIKNNKQHPDYQSPKNQLINQKNLINRLYRQENAQKRPKQSAPESRFVQINLGNLSADRFRLLCAGSLPIVRTIDFHGFYVDQAVRFLNDALNNRNNRKKACWLIIHGKGKHSCEHDKNPLRHAIIELSISHTAVAGIASVIDKQNQSGSLIIDINPKIKLPNYPIR